MARNSAQEQLEARERRSLERKAEARQVREGIERDQRSASRKSEARADRSGDARCSLPVE